MPIISANTLFHFTRSQDTLLKILETGFRPSYCREFGHATDGALMETHIPMVCFCDLPLSNLEKHTAAYGKFGLGLSKEWGKRMQLNPVTYFVNESEYLNFYRGLNQLSNEILQTGPVWDALGKESANVMDNINRLNALMFVRSRMDVISILAQAIFSYIKPYQDLITGQRYYDEREWRFVPKLTNRETPDNFFPVLTDLVPDALELVDKEQQRINNDLKYRLPFKADDIKYIIVNTDDDIEPVIKKMSDLPEKFLSDDINRLTTRILTSEQIHEDF